jgi:hypothetical protein
MPEGIKTFNRTVAVFNTSDDVVDLLTRRRPVKS